MADAELALALEAQRRAAEAEAETERKKALLVYKNQQSASDDDEDEDDSGDERDAKGRDAEAEAEADEEDEEMDEADDVDEEDGGVRVEKDDDESLNAPSDDDLDSTATPRRAETDEEVDDDSRSNGNSVDEDEARARQSPAGLAVDAAGANGLHQTGPAEGDTQRTPAASPGRANEGDGASVTLKSGMTSDVNAIIAARRRTGAKKECEVCHEPRNGRRALLCANCKCMFHSSCFRKQFSKLVHSSGKQWFCPDCEDSSKEFQNEDKDGVAAVTTPKKRRPDGDAPKARRATKSGGNGGGSAKSKGDGDDKHASAAGLASASDVELHRVTEIALRGGKKINALILERTEEMLQVTKALSAEIENTMGPAWQHADSDGTLVGNGNHTVAAAGDSAVKEEDASKRAPASPPPPPFMLVVPTHSSNILNPTPTPTEEVPSSTTNLPNTTNSHGASGHEALIGRLYSGMESLKHMLEQLQVSGIQFEVDLIKDIKLPPTHSSHKSANSTTSRKPQTTSQRGGAGGGSKVKNGASRLYSSKQIHKLEEWYQRSSRPESSEIQAMYRIINSHEFADADLQPEGISVKQIRIWFDNRRAKERLDYMRLKMKDVSTTDMDAESVKRMKAAYIDEAKEVLEARVSRMRENGNGSAPKILDEADNILLAGTMDQSLPTQKPSNVKASPGAKAAAQPKESVDGAKPAAPAAPTNQKKRIRIDYVASVRKAVKDAREAGKNDEEIKAAKTAAIERARERLHVPYKNSRTGPSKPLGKEEVTHIKLKMLKLLEEDAPAEELTDVIELLLSLIIPRDILIDSGFQRQLELVLKAHKDNKELVRQTTKLMDEFKGIIENYNPDVVVAEALVEPVAPAPKKKKPAKVVKEVPAGEDAAGSAPASPTPAASPESRRPRVKFSLNQLVKLEKYFHKEDTPSKKLLDKIAGKLNGIAQQDPSSDEAQKSIDYKQIRCWFYKRRSTNQPPQALTAADIHDLSQDSSSSGTESDQDEGKTSKGKGKSASSKRKATPGSSSTDEKPAVKRPKKDPAASGDVKASKAPGKTDGSAASPSSAASGSKQQHPGRIFNVKQLATIIEEYEKNPRPSVARLEELQNSLNRDDHADESQSNAQAVTTRQIKTWFSNRRAKERTDLIKMKIKETQGKAVVDDDDSDMGDSDSDDGEKQQVSVPAPAPPARIVIRDDDNDDNDDDEDDVDVDEDDEEGHGEHDVDMDDDVE